MIGALSVATSRPFAFVQYDQVRVRWGPVSCGCSPWRDRLKLLRSTPLDVST